MTQTPDFRSEIVNDVVEAAAAVVNESPDDRFIIFYRTRSQARALMVLLDQSLDIAETRDHFKRTADERRFVVSSFADGGVRILLASPIALVGVALQEHCHRVIFVDQVSEAEFAQGVARVDRVPQTQQVRVDHFVSRQRLD